VVENGETIFGAFVGEYYYTLSRGGSEIII
jgi:hypothetical protein